jgi:hypothetical protein
MELGSLPPEYRSHVESLPSRPVSETDLESLLENDSVVEVWVPFPREGLVFEWGEMLAHDEAIFKFWIEDEDQYQAFKHADPLAGGEAWYRYGRPLETGASDKSVAKTLDSFAPLS